MARCMLRSSPSQDGRLRPREGPLALRRAFWPLLGTCCGTGANTMTAAAKAKIDNLAIGAPPYQCEI